MNKNILNFIGCDCEYEEAKIVLFGAPYDNTTSYRPGTRFASREMRSHSFGIETYSPYQDKDLLDIRVFDGGDLQSSFGDPQKALGYIEEYADKIIKDKKIPGMIGGEHLVTLGAVRSVVKQYPDLHMLHFDAHTDLRDTYLDEKLSHATVIRRVWELLGDGRIYQFGIRSGEKEEFLWAKGHVFTQKFDFAGLDEAVSALQGKPVYLTVDLDVLDSSVFPGTGTPEAGGVTFRELIDAIIKVSGLQIVAFDANELCPSLDTSGASTAAACKVLRELLLAVCKSY